MSGAAVGHAGYALLADLPEGDPLRTKPLHSIGAEYKNMKSHLGWIPATIQKLGEFSYNELGAQWVEFNDWRVPVIDRATDG